MNLALIIYYTYLAIFGFVLYYGVAWVYVKIGRFVLDYLFVPAFSPLLFFNWNYIKRNSEFNANKNHIAIVLCNNYMPERMLVYREDIPKLIKYFKKNKWPYKVYFRTDKNKLKDIIQNKKTSIIYIVGHGQRHGVKTGKKEMTYYCEFQKSPKKKFIAQLHCNHLGGKSLVEYLSEKSVNGFVTNKMLSSFGLNKFIDKVTKGEVHNAP